MNEIKIGVFGATGKTGKHVVNEALKRGYKIQALVRNPNKIEIENTNLTLIKGAFTVEAVMNNSLYETYPFVVLKK